MTNQILNLVSHVFERHDNITLINLDQEDTGMFKYMIDAPSYPNINGLYSVWKYSNYGYVWSRETSLCRMILIKTNDINKNNIRHHYIKIYMINKIVPYNVILMAECMVSYRNNMEEYVWIVQDKDKLEWNKINSIRIEKV